MSVITATSFDVVDFVEQQHEINRPDFLYGTLDNKGLGVLHPHIRNSSFEEIYNIVEANGDMRVVRPWHPAPHII